MVEGNCTDWEQKLHSVLWAYQYAYKMAIDTTPFNLVFDPDAILPIVFLIPTLRIAQELKWTSHELSKHIEDLEKLDETRLKVVEGMYVEECCQ